MNLNYEKRLNAEKADPSSKIWKVCTLSEDIEGKVVQICLLVIEVYGNVRTSSNMLPPPKKKLCVSWWGCVGAMACMVRGHLCLLTFYCGISGSNSGCLVSIAITVASSYF